MTLGEAVEVAIVACGGDTARQADRDEVMDIVSELQADGISDDVIAMKLEQCASRRKSAN